MEPIWFRAFVLCDFIGVNSFLAEGYADECEQHSDECDGAGDDEPCFLVAAQRCYYSEHEGGENELCDELACICPDVKDTSFILVSCQVSRE